MIEPQSAQLGASAWVWKLTFVAPRVRVIGAVPPPFPLALAARCRRRVAVGVAVGRDDREPSLALPARP